MCGLHLQKLLVWEYCCWDWSLAWSGWLSSVIILRHIAPVVCFRQHQEACSTTCEHVYQSLFFYAMLHWHCRVLNGCLYFDICIYLFYLLLIFCYICVKILRVCVCCINFRLLRCVSQHSWCCRLLFCFFFSFLFLLMSRAVVNLMDSHLCSGRQDPSTMGPR